MSSITGTKSLARKLKKMRGATDRGLMAGLYTAGLLLQRESQKLVPKKTRDLERSAETRKVPDAAQPTVTVGYGTEYGIHVHERIELRHKPGTQAKFLTQPFREMRPYFMQIVKEKLRKFTRKVI